DNNEFALALVMTIPLLRFLQLQGQQRWLKFGLVVSMVLCAASALGSQSRGALLAIVAMAIFFWIKGKNKLPVGVLLIVVGSILIAFMPDQWSQRMNTINSYEEDRSALGRISAWWTAWNLAWHYPAGVGFNVARADLFALYSPYPDMVHAAHSIYFQVLGNHGFVGLFMFLAIWFTTWRNASWILKNATKYPEAKWCVDIANMMQVSLVAYAVGGAFLSLAYFDLPYNIMALVVITRLWVQRQAWLRESGSVSNWLTSLGISATQFPVKSGVS
ncbi:putative O-glycosylation ligase, exosortase A system-associated, partial [Roseateles sp. GG27B]